MSSAAYVYLASGQYHLALLEVFNSYFPYASFWIMLTLAIYFTTNQVTRNHVMSLAVASMAWIVVIPLMGITGVPFVHELSNYLIIFVGIALGASIILVIAK